MPGQFERNLLSIGHRGAMGHAPENTIASIRKALALGAHCIEIDVQSVDGRIIVFHHRRLEAATNGSGYTLDSNFDMLRVLDAGNGQQIPTLEEVLDAVDRRAGVNIELKSSGLARQVAAVIAGYRQKGWDGDHFLVSSFIHPELVRFREIDRRTRIGALVVGQPLDNAAFGVRLGAYSVHPDLAFVNREFVADAHSCGLRVFVFTVDHPEDIHKMRRMGVDGVFSNYPERVLAGNRGDSLPGRWPGAPAASGRRV